MVESNNQVCQSDIEFAGDLILIKFFVNKGIHFCEDCKDVPENWADIDGDNCKWYKERDCPDYGNRYAKNEKNALQACC